MQITVKNRVFLNYFNNDNEIQKSEKYKLFAIEFLADLEKLVKTDIAREEISGIYCLPRWDLPNKDFTSNFQ